MSDSNASHEPHPWADKTPDDVLQALVHELYSPVSALGGEIDRLATGAFEDDELTTLLGQMREGVDHLSRLVVLLKRYTAERPAQA
jgi:signal transduction histidine kinase